MFTQCRRAGPGPTRGCGACAELRAGLDHCLVFFLIDKRPFVRFQSRTVDGGFRWPYFTGSECCPFDVHCGGHIWRRLPYLLLFFRVDSFCDLAALILWVLCMVKAYQHELFRVPIAADISADSLCKQ